MTNNINADFYLRILVVDDETDYLETFTNIAETFGHKVIGTTNPEQAVTLVDESFEKRNPFDAAFVDFLMPRLNGVKTAKKIKKIDPQLILIAITRDWSIKTRTKIVEALVFRLMIPKGQDIQSFEDLFNLLMNTKLEHSRDEHSRLSREVVQEHRQAAEEGA